MSPSLSTAPPARPARPRPPRLPCLCLVGVLLLLLAASGAEPTCAKEIILRIGLGQGLARLRLSSPQGGQLAEVGGKRLRALRPGETLALESSPPPAPTPSTSRRKEKRRPPPRSPYLGTTLRLEPRGGVFEIDGRPYRGVAVVQVMASGISVISEVGIEDYLRGVVGAEISSQSPLETLRAQAVIARTYAVANRGKHGKDGFDLCSREHCQAYGGVKAERPVIDGAVQDTRGIIMISGGVPISALYHATCGGMTSDNEKVFGGSPTAYLRRVKCPFCKAGTNFRWRRDIRVGDILPRLREEGHPASRILRVRLASPAPLDRVDRLIFFTDRGQIPIKGTTFRRWFELPSTTFQLAVAGPTARPTTARLLSDHLAPPTVSALAPSPNSGRGPPPPVKETAALPDPTSKMQAYRPPMPRLAVLREATPAELVVQGGSGLVRVRRPPAGWHVLTLAAGSPSPPPSLRQSAPVLEAGGSPPLRQETAAPTLDAPEIQEVILDRESGDPIIPLFGRGYGHQVGLCQAGAVELGRRQWSYRQILAFYYSNVALRRLQY